MRFGLNLWPIKGTCRSTARLDGKTVVITGGNCGIGKEVGRDLYWRGARMVLLCRDVAKAMNAMDDIKRNPPHRSSSDHTHSPNDGGEMVVYPLDLGSFDSVRKCAATILESESALHILINNAGVYAPRERKAHDGIEIHFQVNHLSHVLLTLLLLPRIQATGPGCRIVIVSSAIHLFATINFDDIHLESSYNPHKAYAQSKLATIHFGQELTARLKAEQIEGINVYMVHPGIVKTELARDMNETMCCGCHQTVRFLRCLGILKSPEEGAQTVIHAAVSEKIANETGRYYSACKVARPSSKGTSPDYIKRCWELTCKFLELDQELSLDRLSKQAAEKMTAGSENTIANSVKL